MIEVTIGVSLVMNYILKEYLGIISGGFIVPAYIAIIAHKPGRIISTFIVALATLYTVRILRNIMFIYGRRTLMICILVGFSYNYLFLKLMGGIFNNSETFFYELNVIGRIIPGIIAYWMEEQGIIRTVSVMWVNAVITILVIMLIFGRIFLI